MVRHKRFIGRKTSGGKSGSWRPLTFHRAAAKRWASNLDNQFICSCIALGLAFFQWDPFQRGIWSNWRNWPFAAIAMDLGGDGLSGISALKRLFFLNIHEWPDPPHGCNCDLHGALKMCGLFGFWVCLMIYFNLIYGPDKDNLRKHQLSEALESCYANNSPSTTPLFMQNISWIFD